MASATGIPGAVLADGVFAVALFDAFIAVGRARVGKRKAALFRLVCAGGMFRDFGIDEHADAAAIEHSEDADALANHVRREPDAVVRMCGERVRKVACNGEIVLRRGTGRAGKEDRVVKDGTDHGITCWSKMDFEIVLVIFCFR